jgi:hypothetical protein
MPPVALLDRLYRIIIQSREEAINFIENLNNSTWQIYTDGSKANGLTGAGFCIIKGTQAYHRTSYNLGTLPTVYHCVLFALHMASTWVNDNISSPGKIIFFSDSQAALKALNRTFMNSRLVLDIADQLTSLGTALNVELDGFPDTMVLRETNWQPHLPE